MIMFYKLQEDLVEWARQLHNDPDVLCMLTDPHVVSVEEQKQWFDRLNSSSSSERWVVYVGDMEPIGLVRLDQIDHYNKSVCIGLDIEECWRGRGYAYKVYAELFEEWFIKRGFNRVWLLVAEYNHRALHIYEKLGFKREGVQRARLFRNGEFHDYVMMSILRGEYESRCHDEW